MSGLNPLFTSLIGLGGAVIGFGASAVTTAVTVRANRNAARDDRLWDKRAPLYEQLLAPLELVHYFEAGIGADAAAYASAVEDLKRHKPQVFAYAHEQVYRALEHLLARIEDPVPAGATEAWETFYGHHRRQVPATVKDAAWHLMILIREEMQPRSRRARWYQRVFLWRLARWARLARKREQAAADLPRADVPDAYEG